MQAAVALSCTPDGPAAQLSIDLNTRAAFVVFAQTNCERSCITGSNDRCLVKHDSRRDDGAAAGQLASNTLGSARNKVLAATFMTTAVQRVTETRVLTSLSIQISALTAVSGSGY